MPHLSIVIVNWNSGAYLREHLESLHQQNELAGVEVLVVDNASADDSARAADDFPGTLRLAFEENRGFAAAANAGARAARAPLLLFLNPDIVHTPNNLRTLLDAFAACPEVAGGCGRLREPSGRLQEHFQLRRLPTPRWALVDLFFPAAVKTRWPVFRRHYYGHRSWTSSFEVEQPAAACLLLRQAVFEALGGFDEAFLPAWFEDVDLCRRLRNAGHRLRFFPQAEFVHAGGYSASYLHRGEFLTIYWSNARRFYRKHHPAFSRLFDALLPLGFALRAGAAAGRPAERAAWRTVRRHFRHGCEDA
jgi:N-acetylglucosaminyl-diphospho-decaprenol L-rhamnosyltransferase